MDSEREGEETGWIQSGRTNEMDVMAISTLYRRKSGRVMQCVSPIRFDQFPFFSTDTTGNVLTS